MEISPAFIVFILSHSVWDSGNFALCFDWESGKDLSFNSTESCSLFAYSSNLGVKCDKRFFNSVDFSKKPSQQKSKESVIVKC